MRAPQQPKKPTTRTMEPAAIQSAVALRNEKLGATETYVPLEMCSQIPIPNMAHPNNCNINNVCNIQYPGNRNNIVHLQKSTIYQIMNILTTKTTKKKKTEYEILKTVQGSTLRVNLWPQASKNSPKQLRASKKLPQLVLQG